MISNVNHLVEQYDRKLTRNYELSQKTVAYGKKMTDQASIMKWLATNYEAARSEKTLLEEELAVVVPQRESLETKKRKQMELLRRSREYEVAKAWGRAEDKMREKYEARLGKLR